MRTHLIAALALCLSACAASSGAPEPQSPRFGYVQDIGTTRLDTTYVVDGDSDATTSFPIVTTTMHKLLCFHVGMDNGGTPAGGFSIEGSVDQVDWAPPYELSLVHHNANATHSSGDTSIAVSSPAGAVEFLACVKDVLPYNRLVYTRSSGGVADTIDARSFTRSN